MGKGPELQATTPYGETIHTRVITYSDFRHCCEFNFHRSQSITSTFGYSTQKNKFPKSKQHLKICVNCITLKVVWRSETHIAFSPNQSGLYKCQKNFPLFFIKFIKNNTSNNLTQSANQTRIKTSLSWFFFTQRPLPLVTFSAPCVQFLCHCHLLQPIIMMEHRLCITPVCLS